MKRAIATVEDVAGCGLCMGCGTCAGICPHGAITMTENRQGLVIPSVDRARCTDCGRCLEVCPGIEVDFQALNEEVFSRQPEDPLLGVCCDAWLAHSSNAAFRDRASSGGALTELCIHAIELGVARAVVAVDFLDDDPLSAAPRLLCDEEALRGACGSKYIPVPVGSVLSQIRDAEGAVVFVGLPCHIHGLRKAMKGDRSLSEKVVLAFGLACGMVPSRCASEFFLSRHGIDCRDVRHLAYRGQGWPGKISITLADGQTRSLARRPPRTKPLSIVTHMAAFGFHHFHPWRCLTCPDRTAELADVSFSDPYLPELLGTDIHGRTLVLLRNPRARDLIEGAARAGRIVLERLDPGKVRLSHGRHLLPRKALRAPFRACRLSGRSVPVFRWGVPLPRTVPIHHSVDCLLAVIEQWMGRSRSRWFLIRSWVAFRLLTRLVFRILGRLCRRSSSARPLS